jgi:hypothetical protein
MPAIGAAQYTELVASTLEKIEADLADQLLLRHPTLSLFREKSQSETGRALVYNLEGGEDGDTTFTDASGTFNTDVSPEIIGAAVYEWSAPLVSKVRVVWKQLQMNSGKQQLVDLLDAHIKAAKKQHAKAIARGLHALAGDWNPNAFESFDRIVHDSVTVGGIDPAAKDYWQSHRITVPVADMTIRKAFRHVRNELTVATSDQSKVTNIIAGRDVFEELEDSFDDKVRYVEFGKGQTRFRAIMDGDVEVRLDPDCQANRAYFLDVDTWRFRYLNGNFMKVQPAQVITGTLDFVTPLASVLAVGTNERRANAVLIRDYS